jgi:hypothetical protein
LAIKKKAGKKGEPVTIGLRVRVRVRVRWIVKSGLINPK